LSEVYGRMVEFKVMGIFGQTHCLQIAKYLEENFEIVAQFGDWENPYPGWIWNHGVRIYKRVK